MGYALFADLVVCLHLGFVLFVLFGGFLALKRPRAIWLHLPAAAWGILVEFTGWICPLTPLEQWLRTRSGGSALQGDFLSRYLLPILYPDFLTPRSPDRACPLCPRVESHHLRLGLAEESRRTTVAGPSPRQSSIAGFGEGTGPDGDRNVGSRS